MSRIIKKKEEDVGLAHVIEKYDIRGVLVMIIWFVHCIKNNSDIDTWNNI